MFTLILFSRAMVAISNVCWTNLVHDSIFRILFVYQWLRLCSVKETVFMFSKVPVNSLNLSDSHQSRSLNTFDSNCITFFADGSQTGNRCLNYRRKMYFIQFILDFNFF